MASTVTCPRCSRTVPWTDETWSTRDNCCRDCAEGRTLSPRPESTIREPFTGARTEQSVRLTGLDVPFGDLVGFMVKAAFASVPAGIIVGMVFGLLYALWKMVSA